MSGKLDKWFMFAVWTLVIGQVIFLSYSLLNKPNPLPPGPPEIVHYWSPAEEAEMEWLLNNLNWDDPNVCKNPQVIKYNICEELFNDPEMASYFND